MNLRCAPSWLAFSPRPSTASNECVPGFRPQSIACDRRRVCSMPGWQRLLKRASRRKRGFTQCCGSAAFGCRKSFSSNRLTKRLDVRCWLRPKSPESRWRCANWMARHEQSCATLDETWRSSTNFLFRDTAGSFDVMGGKSFGLNIPNGARGPLSMLRRSNYLCARNVSRDAQLEVRKPPSNHGRRSHLVKRPGLPTETST